MGRGQRDSSFSAMAVGPRGMQSGQLTRRGAADDELLMFELAGMVAGRDRWPTRQQFTEAGQADLFWKTHRAGGAARWAPQFGLEFDPEPDPERPAPVAPAARARRAPREGRAERRERLIRELEVFCTGRDFFPSRADWKAVGRTDLQNFVHNNGGAQHWAAEMGLPLRSIQDRTPYTLDRALTDGRRMIERYGRIPTRNTLNEHGLVRLDNFIRREHGGDRSAFAQRCR